MNMKKLIAALLVMVMLLSAVSALAATIKAGTTVVFVGSAYGYKGHNARHKTKTIVSKGSWSVAVGNQNGNWVPVYLDVADFLWFNTKYVKAANIVQLAAIEATGLDHLIRYGSGGYGRSVWNGTVRRHTHAYSYVKATGKCNIREGAGLAYKTYGTLKKGKKLNVVYADDGYFYGWIDTRGVEWYPVAYKGKIRFVSSLYTDLYV